MSRSSTLCEFVTPIINGQPTSRLENTRVPTESKKTRNGRKDGWKEPLVSHCDNEDHEIIEMRHQNGESMETTHLLCGKTIYQTIERFGGSKNSTKDTESFDSDLKHYTIDPVCMNIRIFIFWFLWATLIVVLIISVLSYCCLEAKTCSKETITVNKTST